MGELTERIAPGADRAAIIEVEDLVKRYRKGKANAVDGIWKPTAEEQAARRTRGERLTHRLTTLPGVSRRSRLLLGPLQGLVVDA